MANAHSHAFQLDLRGVGERPHPGDDFWSWRTEMYRLAGSHDPDVDARGRRARLHADGGRRLRRRRRVSLRRAPARRDAVRRAQRDGDRARAGGRLGGLEIVLLPAAYHRGGAGRAPRCRPAAVLRSATSTRSWRGLDALRAWAADRRRRARRRRRAQRPRRAGRVDRGGRDYADERRSRPPRPRLASSGASWPSATPSTAARRSSCCDRRAFSGRARASCTRSTSTDRDIELLAAERLDRRHLPDDGGQPRRRLPAGAALPRRRGAARDRDRLAGPDRPVRGAARDGDARAPRAPDPVRAAGGRGRRSVGADRRQRARQPRARRARCADRDRPRLTRPGRGVASATCALALATCASSAVVRR